MELAQQVEIWRQKSREGSLSDEEMRQAIDILRAGRVAAASSAKPVGQRVQTAKAISNITFEDI